MRVAILGNSGSGKSTLQRQLAAQHRLPTLDLDTVAWAHGKIAVARPHAEAEADVRTFCTATDGWVVEGCYAGLVEISLRFMPVFLFLEPGVEVCLAHCRSRPFEPHKYKSKAEQDEKLAFLLDWVKDYYTRDDDMSLVAHQESFDRYKGPKLKLDRPPGPEFALTLDPTTVQDMTIQ